LHYKHFLNYPLKFTFEIFPEEGIKNFSRNSLQILKNPWWWNQKI